MTRGILYHVTTDKDLIDEVDAQDFSGHEKELSIEGFCNRNGIDANGDIVKLTSRLREAGFDIEANQRSVVTEITMNGQEQTSCSHLVVYSIQTGDAKKLDVAKENYFRDAFENLRKTVDGMSIKTFATDPCSVCDIMRHVDDRYADAVALDLSSGALVYTMMQFIRRLAPNRTYYISTRTIKMQ